MHSLVIVSKIFQNIVNGVPYDGSKEQYMTVMNDLISEFNPKIEQLLHSLLFTGTIPVKSDRHNYPAQLATSKAITCILQHGKNYFPECMLSSRSEILCLQSL